MAFDLFPPEITYSLGWTLLHALWQGAFFALLLGGLLIVLRKFSPQARYLVAIGVMSAFLLSAGATFTQLYQSAPYLPTAEYNTINTPVGADAGTRERVGVDLSSTQGSATSAVSTSAPLGTALSMKERMSGYFNTHLPLIVTLWLLGVLAMQLRFLGQLAYVQRVKNYGVSRFPVEWAATIQGLEEKMGVRRHIRYLTSGRVSSPITAGWMRPAILFPNGLLEELKQSDVVSILAHELAHVRRNDYLVGLVQAFINTFFFFHPGVWWMNARIADEREHCCDDLAIAATGQPVGYAQTLLALQSRNLAAPGLAMAATGPKPGSLTYRIQRLFSGGFSDANFQEGLMTGFIICLAFYLAIFPKPLDGLSAQTPPQANGEPETHLSAPATAPLDEQAEALEQAAIAAKEQQSTREEMLTAQISSAEALDLQTAALRQQTALTASEASEFELFLRAVADGRMNTVKLFLDRGMDVNRADESDRTPIFYAIAAEEIDVLELLIKRGAEVNYINKEEWTPLMLAAKSDCQECVTTLLVAGAEPEYRASDGRTATSIAEAAGHARVTRALGGEVSDNSRLGPAMCQAICRGDVREVKSLIRRGVNLNALVEGHAHLSSAAEAGRMNIVKALVEAGADVNLVDHHNQTALDQALAEDQAEVAAYLLDAGVNTSPSESGDGPTTYRFPNGGGNLEPGDDGYYPGYEGYEGYKGHEGYSGFRQNEETGAYESTGSTIEWPGWASMTRAKNILADQQISSKVYPFRGDDGTQRIHYFAKAPEVLMSVRNNSADPLIAEIKAGSDLNEGGTRYTYIIDPSVKMRKVDFLADLKSPGQVSLVTVRNWTPLMDAAERGFSIAVKLLLDAGADPDEVNSDGKTAYQVARAAGQTQIVRMLER